MAVHGRYTIVGKLADGGMAEIFLGMQNGAEGFQKPVVLKRILTAFSADPQFRNMFLDEAHISMSLNHSNIVQVLDLGVSRGRYFLVLELVDGWDLDKILRRAKGVGMVWPPALSLYITAEVCRALAFAHGKAQGGRPLGIVHRDISPNNVLISEQGEVKLADFGIAKAQRKREQTAAGIIKGKIAFMSPEQAIGGAIDRRADLFSVGSMLYLMATDRLPFESATDLEAILRVQRADFTPPDKVKPDVGVELSRIIMRAMRLAPAERYQTADEMLSDVERVLRTEYHSAGQSELKLWIGQLARRDGAPPIGKTGEARPAAGRDTIGTDLNVGASFELGDLDDASGLTDGSFTPGAVVMSGTPTPPPQVAPSPPPSPLAAAPLGTDATQMVRDTDGGRPAEPQPKSRGLRGFWFGATFALAAVIGARYVIEWARAQPFLGANPVIPAAAPPAEPPPPAVAPPSIAAKEGAARPATVAPAPLPLLPDPAAATARPVAQPARDGGPVHREEAVAAAAPVRPDAGVAMAAAAAKGDSDDEPDEEALLRDALPNAESAVIGEEEADRPAGSSDVAGKGAAGGAKTSPLVAASAPSSNSASAPASSKASPALAPHAETVSLRLTSNPVGAVVRTRYKVLGRTPISLHFKSGNTYELTFIKRGYAQTVKRVAVPANGAKDRKVAVALKKNHVAAKRSSLFHPHR
jgi:serine/threonine-protein kinase